MIVLSESCRRRGAASNLPRQIVHRCKLPANRGFVQIALRISTEVGHY